MVKIDDNKDELLIGLISDTHIPYHGPKYQEIFIDKIPEEIIKDFKQKNVDYVFHLGDYAQYRIFEELQEIFGKDKVIGISGNMDESEVHEKLPETMELELYNYKIFMVHGAGGPNMIIRRLNKQFDLSKYDIIICGHIHRPLNEKRDGRWYIGPGTPTDTKFAEKDSNGKPKNSYGYLKIGKGIIEPEIVYL